MKDVPDGNWTCPRCAVEQLPGKVEKILTWRWKEEEEEEEEVEDKKAADGEPVAGSSKNPPKKKATVPSKVEREFFIKWKDQSYWHCR